jgi:hypothetical protein
MMNWSYAVAVANGSSDGTLAVKVSNGSGNGDIVLDFELVSSAAVVACQHWQHWRHWQLLRSSALTSSSSLSLTH